MTARIDCRQQLLGHIDLTHEIYFESSAQGRHAHLVPVFRICDAGVVNENVDPATRCDRFGSRPDAVRIGEIEFHPGQAFARPALPDVDVPMTCHS
ncbi:MAG TPA: hypothetical protein VFW28_03135 [Micropepsaceae bacterium]|nr:hypothetical protein [Micropepsaceae bacterium]